MKNTIASLQLNNNSDTFIPKIINKNPDVAISITSHERYDKIVRLLNQFKDQKTKYSFQIILLNDGSKDVRYDELPKIFSEIIYIKNNIANGKLFHWLCYNQLWMHLKEIKAKFLLQMDDDFILCDSFLDTIVNTYFEQKYNDNRIIAIAPHSWSFDKNSEYDKWWRDNTLIDGITLINTEIIKKIDYKLQPVGEHVKNPGCPVGVWQQIRKAVIDNNFIFYRTLTSLVFHDGLTDSKLHKDYRINGKHNQYTKRWKTK